ncbi:polysaccharide pyruvyl transferase family protein [Georgenia muralis]
MNHDIDGAHTVGALYDSISPNTGDRAIGIAVSQELARLGISPTTVVPPFEEHGVDDGMLRIVGGGELLRPVGDAFYDRFRPRGPHVLNSVGVWSTADELEHLKEYRYVSARSSREVDVLRAVVPDAELVPCTTTTLESAPFQIEGLPDDGEPVVGIHVVPHTLSMCPELVEAVNGIPHRKVFIPFTHYNHDDSFMASLPFDRTRAIALPRLTPEQLHSVLGQMTYVVVSSLHATIFAYSQNVPFATVHQEKVENYLRDRDLQDLIFHDNASLSEAVHRLGEAPPDLTETVARDKAAVHASFRRIAEIAGLPTGDAVEPVLRAGPDEPSREVVQLIAAQREEVVLGRDAVLGTVTRRATAAYADAARLDGALREAERALAEERARVSDLEAQLEEARRLPGAARAVLRASREAVRSRVPGTNGSAHADGDA